MRTDREAQGKAEGPGKDKGGLVNRGGLAGGQGASTETGEHTGSKQRPDKTRDFEKCVSMPKTFLLYLLDDFGSK